VPRICASLAQPEQQVARLKARSATGTCIHRDPSAQTVCWSQWIPAYTGARCRLAAELQLARAYCLAWFGLARQRCTRSRSMLQYFRFLRGKINLAASRRNLFCEKNADDGIKLGFKIRYKLICK
jgi:hypothetical protein